MKARIQLRLLAVALLAATTLSAAAQTDVRVNKVWRAQKLGKQTVLRSTDSRLPQNVVMFDHEEDLSKAPQEFLDFLESYEEALARMDAGEDASSVISIERTATLEDSVGPILGAIAFDQETPYNDKCPIINSGRAVTGCVATAMAEIMTFWKYPAVGVGTTTYTGSNGAQTYNFADHPFDWDHILPTYTRGNYTSTQANAISELMLACGASVNMNYSAEGSGAASEKAFTALRDYFGYDSSIEYLHDAEDNIIQTVWVAVLKSEFNAGRPVYYAGSTQRDGHAFCMDGYKTDGSTVWFHVNWGWNGAYNGWYLISFLKPKEKNYSAYSNDIIFNIFPPGSAIENTEEEVATKVNMNAPVYTILGNKIPASSMQRGMIYIQSGRKFVW